MVYNEQAKELAFENQPQVLYEAYFGRTPQIEAIIKQIGKIRDKAGTNWKYNPAINTWPETQKLNNLIGETFGFRTVSVTFIQDIVPNAYTVPISTSSDIIFLKKPKSMIESNKTGFRYKKEANYCLWINVTTALFLNSKLSDAEVTAVLLHEIGHNFSAALSGSLGGLAICNVLFNIIDAIVDIVNKLDYTKSFSMIMNNNFTKTIISKINEILMKFAFFQGLAVVGDAINIVINVVKQTALDIVDLLMSFNPVASISVAASQATSTWPFQILKLLFGGYRDEQFADAFPGMYGLGVELTAALSELEYGSKGTVINDIVHKTPVIGHIANAIQFPIVIMSTIFESHPNLEQRFKLELELLERELKENNIDPKMKNEIKKQINEIKKRYDKYFSEKAKFNIDPKDTYALNKAYQSALASTGGGLTSNIFNKDTVFTDIDKARNASSIDKIKFK